MERLLVSPDDAAEALGLSRSRIYELMASGSLRSVKIGKSRRIPSTALREFCEQLEADATPRDAAATGEGSR